MPQFAANLSMLYPELDFLDRFDAAARDGFKGVEYLFPYAYDKQALAALPVRPLQQERAPERIRGFPGAQNPSGLGQPVPDASPQFGRGRLRKGHDQDLRHLEARLQHHPQIQPRDGECLAGARAGLQKRHAGLQGCGPQLKRLRCHGVPFLE